MAFYLARRLVPAVAALLLAWAVAAAPVRAAGWSDVAREMEQGLTRAVGLYGQGRAAEARQAVDGVYFGLYEKKGMEAAVRLKISARRAAQAEYAFTSLKRLMAGGAPPQEVDQAARRLLAQLAADAGQLDGRGRQQGGWADFLSAFLIIVREGLEAILVLAALIATLVKGGHAGRLRTIYGSALAALLASLLTAWLLGAVFRLSGAGQEILEGVVMLVAVGVLFFVSYWLLAKAEADRWQRYIREKVSGSLSSGNLAALWWAGFLAVYREGAETVLFYQALLAGGAGAGPVVLGLALGMAVLVLVFLAVRYGSVRLPLRPFFTVTGLLLYYMAFVFAGQGVKELQAGGLIASTALPGVPVIDWLGIYPTWQGLGLQGVLLLLALAALAVLRRGSGRKAGQARA